MPGQVTTHTFILMNTKVDWYFDEAVKWQDGIRQLRTIIAGCQLNEELKWGNPCYTFQGRNIILIHVFKEYFAVLFFKGALLKDPKGVLIQQSENVQAARQMRFTSLQEVNKLAATLKAYVFEAVEVEEKGLKVPVKQTREYTIPEELQTKLDTDSGLKEAFAGLTPGRQRAYLLHFSAPKQSKTRESRIEKCIPGILAGKGLKED